MSFVVTAALALALLVVVPIAAHLLRRGRAAEHEFPPAALVPAAPPVARQRSRLEDRALLAARGLMIAALALLGAIPLVRCDRLTLARAEGASVAVTIVLDDSLSMRMTTGDGRTRWARAHAAAQEVLTSGREGDVFAIVLAGRPARVALAATSDRRAARRALESLTVSDRATDLAGAMALARSALAELPHVDQRVLLLSDLAGEVVPAGTPPAWTPLAALREPTANCAITSAERRGRRVTANVACSSSPVAQGRVLEVVAGEPTASDRTSSAAPRGTVVGRAELLVQAGVQVVVVELDGVADALDVRLTGSDGIAHDDGAPVAPEASAFIVAVLADTIRAGVSTGGATVIEQALHALELGAQVRPLTQLPDDAAAIAPFGVLILDDPPGLSPEAREAVATWTAQGGVALLLLGPNLGATPLGSSFEPFLVGAAAWAPTDVKGIDPATSPTLGPEAASLANLGAKSRAVLAGAVPRAARILGAWDDGQPWLFAREHERGYLLTAGLPSSPAVSDFALRPGFLALLHHLVGEAARRHGPRNTVAGAPWTFNGLTRVQIDTPERPGVEVFGDASRTVYTPALRGRYQVRLADTVHQRTVTIDPEEILQRPREPGPEATSHRVGAAQQVDVSREIALALLGLFALELLLRAWRRRASRADEQSTMPSAG